MIITFISISLLLKNKIKNHLPATIVIFSLLVLVPIEILSSVKMLNRTFFIIYWLLLIILSIIIIYKNRNVLFAIITPPINNYILLMIVLLSIIFIIALLLIPYEWDCMTYHLPRIEHWVRNRTINHYIANYSNQITRPVMHEFILTHLRLITNNDYLYNLVSFFSLVITILLANDILNKFYTKGFIKYISLIMILTSPIFIGEALTELVDLFSAIYLLAFIDIIIDFYKKTTFNTTKNDIIQMSICGFLLGFGYLAKYTIIICALPYIFIFCIFSIYKKINIKSFISYAVIAALSFLIIVLPLFIRNLSFFNNIFANMLSDSIVLNTFNPKYIFINFLKNSSLLCSFPFIDKISTSFVVFISSLLGVNVNDSLISFTRNYESLSFGFHCDASSAFLQGILFPIITILILAIIIVKHKKIVVNEKLLFFIPSYFSIFLLLLLIKYSRYNNRLFIPNTILMCILLGIMFSYISSNINNKVIKFSTHSLFIIMALSFTLTCLYNIKQIRYYINKDRILGYFDNRRYEYIPYKKICETIKKNNYKKIGFWGDREIFEYPLWKMIDKDVEIYGVIQKGEKTFIVENNANIDCIVAISCKKNTIKEKIEIDYYHCIYEKGNNNFIQEFY